MNKVLGFIGCGNMGSAMVGGIIKSGIISAENIIVSDIVEQSIKGLKDKFGINTALTNKEVVERADIVVLAVKPFMYEKVIKEIRDNIKDTALIVTIAAGVGIGKVREWFGKDIKIVKTMPNTPALVGEGMSAVCPSEGVSEEEIQEILNIFSAFGKAELLEEKDFHAFTALCGSSPAYVFMFIEAMADSAVKMGIPRKKAYNLAAQAVLGSAKMVLETGMHPGELKDMVCSPGGTTIEAVLEFEKRGFRAAVMNGMEKCEQKSKNM
ncbi:pyrroline-5-carboxylate reductase [Clostridium polyendosporum]|uniref:Pyrroline-5-carboxylate reductase n=1 Tax=Clostridium polyendosporum TaxID=69208 RepID=A0A919S026_9CLOT|nr:pyrroline-5-carboxylate reductase [Clostridium polyendosporum]GIM28954.1 pyrroline-5-carboxylate reductase [Clostridium polyendosporum]